MPANTASARDRLEQALARIADPAGEGARACLTVYAETARAAADAADARGRAGISLGTLDGAIVSIKDLFDVAGEPTRAGSTILAQAAPATADAPVVRRLRAAGAVIVAKTNMTEFAFSGVGVNPHYGTPGNPADRTRVPGGSSSGGAVAVADGLCEIAIGSDTGGSTRVPAALCGLVGFKPSQWRVPTQGAFPLSHTLDSIGPMARNVAHCAAADAVMAGGGAEPLTPMPLAGLRLGLAQGFPIQALDEAVSARYAETIGQLAAAGARLTEESLPQLDRMTEALADGGIVHAEAFAIHREHLAARAGDFDPLVRMRIELGRDMSAAGYIRLLRERNALAAAMDRRLADLDALVMPTSPIVAPKTSEVTTPETFTARNTALLRNTAVANFFDLAAISLPLPRRSGLPVGLMLIARNGHDRRLLRMAAAVEQMLTAQ